MGILNKSLNYFWYKFYQWPGENPPDRPSWSRLIGDFFEFIFKLIILIMLVLGFFAMLSLMTGGPAPGVD